MKAKDLKSKLLLIKQIGSNFIAKQISKSVSPSPSARPSPVLAATTTSEPTTPSTPTSTSSTSTATTPPPTIWRYVHAYDNKETQSKAKSAAARRAAAQESVVKAEQHTAAIAAAASTQAHVASFDFLALYPTPDVWWNKFGLTQQQQQQLQQHGYVTSADLLAIAFEEGQARLSAAQVPTHLINVMVAQVKKLAGV